MLGARKPRRLRSACLLSKPSRRKVEVNVEYVGFTIEDRFVVGYGLDYAEAYRALPFIGVVQRLSAAPALLLNHFVGAYLEAPEPAVGGHAANLALPVGIPVPHLGRHVDAKVRRRGGRW